MKWTTQRNIHIVTIIMSVLIIVGGVMALVYGFPENMANGVTLYLDDGSELSENIRLENMYPGDESCCLVKFSCFGGNESVVIEFAATSECALAEHIEVIVEADGETAQSARLVEYLNGDEIRLTRKWQRGEHEIKLRFVLPQDVGNEAKGASAYFEMRVSKEL